MSRVGRKIVLHSFITSPPCISISYEKSHRVLELAVAMLYPLSVFLAVTLMLGRSPVDSI